MIKVTVKNNGQNTLIVPLQSLVPQAHSLIESAAAGESASCVFLPPTDSASVQSAIVAWGEENGLSIDVAFEPAEPVTTPSQPPTPGIVPNPSNPLGI